MKMLTENIFCFVLEWVKIQLCSNYITLLYKQHHKCLKLDKNHIFHGRKHLSIEEVGIDEKKFHDELQKQMLLATNSIINYPDRMKGDKAYCGEEISIY